MMNADRESQRTLFCSRLALLRQAIRTVLFALENDISFAKSLESDEEKSLNEKSLELLIDLVKDCITGDVTCDPYITNLRRKVFGCLPQEGNWSDGRVFVSVLQSLLCPGEHLPSDRKQELIYFFLHLLSRVDHAYHYQQKKAA